jgi:hypothetical protein
LPLLKKVASKKVDKVASKKVDKVTKEFLTPLFLKVAKWQSGSKGVFDATFFKSGKVAKWQSGKSGRVAAKEVLTPLFLKVAEWQQRSF